MGKRHLKTRLMVMRSGLTEWDVAQRVQGATDLPLSEQGRADVQADLAGVTGVEVVLSAPDEASRETSRMLAEATNARIVVVGELAELGLGLWEGLRYDDLERRFCRAGRLFFEDPQGVMAPEGEALGDYSQRLMKAFAKNIKGQLRGVQTGAVVLRPIALGLVRCALNGAEIGQMWSMVTDRPSVEWYEIERTDPRLAPPPRNPKRVVAA